MAEEKWIPNKFELEEEQDLEFFKSFTNFALMKDYFHKTGDTEYGTMVDTVNQNITGGTVVVELKYRKPNATAYTDCFIEVYKYNNLWKLYRKGCLPMYLNYIGGKYYLWIIPSISGFEMHKNMPIRSSISGKKYADRYGLKWEDAWIFDSEGNLIQRSACEDIIPNLPKHHNINFNQPITNDILNNL